MLEITYLDQSGWKNDNIQDLVFCMLTEFKHNSLNKTLG